MAYCTRCGAQVGDSDAFCTSCGQPLLQNEQKQNNDNDGIPRFTAPAPTFEPPKGERPEFDGRPVCYYHQGEPAVAKCARCGKFICKDCFDSYGVSSGEYAGQALCYDCCQQLVAENIEELEHNKKIIKSQFILSIVGMVIGFIVGICYGIVYAINTGAGVGVGIVLGLIYGVFVALLGGVFLTYIKLILRSYWEAIKTIFSDGFVVALIQLLIATTVGAVKCMWLTISNTIFYIKYLKETAGFIESDTAALQEMTDYMEYTMIRNQNKGVDIETLLNQRSELANNSYAHMVREKGEEGAEAALRDCVATINENGEIIRSFNDRAA